MTTLPVGSRITLFITALAAGGAERAMLTLAGAFVTRGMRVDLVLTCARGSLLSEVPSGVRVVDLGARRIIAALPVLVRYLRRERPEVMLSALGPTNCLALWAKRLAGVCTRIVVAEHSTLTQATAHTMSLRAKLLPSLMRWTYPQSDAVVAVSEGVADDLVGAIGLERSRVEVIYNPVVTPSLVERADEPLDHPWFQPGQRPVILGAGRLIPLKNFASLIHAFAKVRAKRPVRLMILGEGEERARLEALARELEIDADVSLPGFMENPHKYIKRAAMLVLPSHYEGLPTVLIEAMALKTPVVATDCPSGPREILEDGRWGRLVPVGSSDALAASIIQALDVPGAPAHERARAFGIDQATDKYLRVLTFKKNVDDERRW